MSEPKPASVYIAIPTYGGIESAFVESCLHLQLALTRLGVPHEFVFLPGESLITRARNRLVRVFLDDHKDRTHLLFLDADLVFHPATILRLLTSGHEVCAAPYARKDMTGTLIGNLDAINVREVDGKVRGEVDRKAGFVRAKHAGTGCMLIARTAFEKMIARTRPDGQPAMVPYTCDLEPGRPKTYPFFDSGPEDGRDPESRLLSEDYWFCRLWQTLGDGSVWLDENAKIRHIGKHAYVAKSFAEQWKGAAE